MKNGPIEPDGRAAAGADEEKEFLAQMEKLIPWREWVEKVKPCYYKGKRGNKPYEWELMLRLVVYPASNQTKRG